MGIIKEYRYELTTEEGVIITGFILAERKLTANVLITKRYIKQGFYNFKVNIK